MKDALITIRNKFFSFWKLEDSDISLELRWLLAIIEIIADYISSTYLIFINSFNLKLEILSGAGEGKSLIFGVVDFLDWNGSSLGKQSNNLIFNNASTLDLTVDIEISLLLELIDNWDS